METGERNIGEVDGEYSARWLYSRLTKADPQNAASLAAWANLESKDGRFREAERLYVRAADRSRDRDRRGLNHCNAARMAGRLHESKRQQGHLQAALAANAENAFAHALLGRCYGFEERWSEAEEHFSRALELDPQNAMYQDWYDRMRSARNRDLFFDSDPDSGLEFDCD